MKINLINQTKHVDPENVSFSASDNISEKRQQVPVRNKAYVSPRVNSLAKKNPF